MAGKFDTIGYPDAGLGSMARAGPNTPAWWSDTNASWNPETGLDIYGNYGGPIGTSGPMGAGGGDRGDAANISNGWTQPSTGQTPQQPPAMMGGAPSWLSDISPSWDAGTGLRTGLDASGKPLTPSAQAEIRNWMRQFINVRGSEQEFNSGQGYATPATPTTTGIGGLPTPDLTSTGQTPPISGMNFNPATNSYNPFAIGAGGVGAGATGAGLFGSGLFGGQLQNYMMQPSMNTASLYDALMGFRKGLFGQQLQPNAMMRMAYPGSNMNTGYPMQRSISQPMQQQFNQQQPAFFDSLAYRPL